MRPCQVQGCRSEREEHKGHHCRGLGEKRGTPARGGCDSATSYVAECKAHRDAEVECCEPGGLGGGGCGVICEGNGKNGGRHTRISRIQGR